MFNATKGQTMKTNTPQFHFDRIAFSDTWAVWHTGTVHIVFKSERRSEAKDMAEALTNGAAAVVIATDKRCEACGEIGALSNDPFCRSCLDKMNALEPCDSCKAMRDLEPVVIHKNVGPDQHYNMCQGCADEARAENADTRDPRDD